MRDWLSSLSVDRLPEIALGLAFGYAFISLAESFARIPVSVLVQHFGRNPFDDAETLGIDLSAPYLLNVSIGGTVIAYGQLLVETLALALVALGAWYVVRRRDRVLGVCPFCTSQIPHASTHCAYCGSGVAPSEP